MKVFKCLTQLKKIARGNWGKYYTPTHLNHLFHPPTASHALSKVDTMREIIYFIKIVEDFEKWAARFEHRGDF